MTTLGAPAGLYDTTLTFDAPYSSTADYPIPMTVDSEKFELIGGKGSRVVSVRRGSNGSTQASHAIGATVMAGWGTGGSGVTVDNGVDAPAAVTTLVAPGAVIAGSSATLINLQLLGPFPVAWNTPGFMTPPDDWGPELLTIPAGCLFQVFAFITTVFNQPGFMEIRLTPDPTGFAHAIDLAKYYGVSTPRVDTGAAVESRRVISSETGVGTLDNVLPRWGFTPDERSVVASYQPDADDATAGAADIYALIATPAV